MQPSACLSLIDLPRDPPQPCLLFTFAPTLALKCSTIRSLWLFLFVTGRCSHLDATLVRWESQAKRALAQRRMATRYLKRRVKRSFLVFSLCRLLCGIQQPSWSSFLNNISGTVPSEKLCTVIVWQLQHIAAMPLYQRKRRKYKSSMIILLDQKVWGVLLLFSEVAAIDCRRID